MTADAKSSNAVPIQDQSHFSTLDKLLLGPIVTPFFLLGFGLLAWVAYQFFGDYVAAAHAPAVPIAWWQWPWGWPGARLVEALCAALGLPAVSDFPLSNLLLPFTYLPMVGRVFLAYFVNCLIAFIPLYLAVLLIGTVARAYRWKRGDFVSS